MRYVAITLCALAACGHPAKTDGADAGSDLAMAPLDLAPVPDLAPMGPTLLSQTGLYSDFPSRTLVPNIFKYVPRYPLWSDGAEKERMLLLPPGTKIDTSDMDNWVFPIGTKLWKEFRQNGTLVETRLLQKMAEGADGWWKTAYVWNPDGSDAVATVDPVPNALGTTHDVPSQEHCAKCHDNVRDEVIGVSAIQLSAAGGNGALTQLIGAGLLSKPPSGEFEIPGQGVVKDALGYLHGNCGHCHNEGSTFASKSVLRLRLRVTDKVPESTPSYTTSINVKMYHYMNGIQIGVVPGAPDMSQLYYRMSVRNDDAMPPVCTKLVDTTGLATVRSWISSLPH